MKLAINAIYETLEKKRDLISKGIDVEKSYEWVPWNTLNTCYSRVRAFPSERLFEYWEFNKQKENDNEDS